MQKNFVVYRSSAGSGKTFTLVKEYLKIALSEATDQPQLYKKILAVTFTNKAAAEMKERIIDALKKVSASTPSDIPLITSILSNEMSLAVDVLAFRAGNLLSQILHNYSDFSISTIDSFTHKIVKTFAFDLKLPVNFSVETNVKEFYTKVVSDLISKIGDDKDLTKLLSEFSINNATENNSWDPEPLISKFTDTLEKEESAVYLEKLKKLSKEELAEIHKTLNEFIAEFKGNLKLAGTKALQLIREKHLSDVNFFNTTKGPQNFFKKCSDFEFDGIDNLVNQTIQNAVNNNKWQGTKNNANEAATLDSIIPQLNTIAGKTIVYLNENYKHYALCKLLEKNIYSLILVNELQQIAEQFKQDEQIIFISEFNSKIAKIVSEEPAPFIYERLGERYNHYLLDEFQDTSTLQWQNILPLIDNSLGNGKFNLVVGDGKQSIYRWRNANVKQFSSLPNIEGAENNELVNERQNSLNRNYKAEPLNTNYRSLATIVDFNNSLFDFLPDNLLHPSLKDIYSLQSQTKKHHNGGYVSVNAGETEKDLLDETTCQLILKQIQQSLQTNFNFSDVCIITRNNHHGNLIANFLIQNKIPVVSSESLLLKNCSEINCIISFLNYLINPSDKISASSVINYVYKNGQVKGDLSPHLKKLLRGNNLFDVLNSIDIPFKEEDLFQKNVFDTCVEIITRLKLHERDPQYIRFFLDEVNDYLVNKTGSVNNFIEWWEKRSMVASIIIPDGSNAVRIMTIHKSKGLEFPVVILPFVNWDTYKMQSNWVDLENENTALPAGLFNISSGISEAGLSSVFETEEGAQILDNLNLLYVAFTRAVERLHIITVKSKTNKKSGVSKWIDLYLSKHAIAKEPGFFEFGILSNKFEITEKKQSAIFNIAQLHFNDNPHLIKIKGAHKLNLEDETETAREKGIKMHYIFSEINSKKDIQHVLSKMLKQGIIVEKEISELEAKITELLSHKELDLFFSSEYKSKNECELITENGELLRPDKIVFNTKEAIVIDYKTGKQNTKVHQKQMNKYQEALQRMGYGSVRKVLVYIEENLVEELQ